MRRAFPEASLAAGLRAALPARWRTRRGPPPVTDAALPSTHCANQGVAVASPAAAVPDPAAHAASAQLLAGDSPRRDAEWRASVQLVRMLRRAARGQRDAVRRVRAKAQRTDGRRLRLDDERAEGGRPSIARRPTSTVTVRRELASRRALAQIPTPARHRAPHASCRVPS